MIAAKAGSNPYKGYGVVAAKAGCPDLTEESDDEPPELIESESEEEPGVAAAKAGSNRRGSAHPGFILSDCLSDTDEDEEGNLDFWAYATPALSARVANPISF